MMRYLFISFFLFGIVQQAIAQSFHERMDSLSGVFFQLRQSTKKGDLDIYSEEIVKIIEDILPFSEAFTADFSGFKTLGAITSPDGVFRLINWNVEYPDGTHKYYAYILKPAKNSNKVIKLENKVRLMTKGSEMETFEQKRWYGALYYQIIPVKTKSGTYYTLLGWDGYSKLSTRRIIETMSFSGNKVKFGLSVIKHEKGTIKRIVFEYMDEISMVIRLDNKKKTPLIVFEHLSPRAPQLEGMWEQYVPDGSYDALELRDGFWHFIPDYDATNSKDSKDKLYSDPRNDIRP